MARPRFLADEHVLRVFVTTLRSSGFEVERAQERYGQSTSDASIVDDCREASLVVLTNDRDLVRLADEGGHAGIVLYTERKLLLDAPLDAVRAIERVDHHYSTDEIQDIVEWLDNWV